MFFLQIIFFSILGFILLAFGAHVVVTRAATIAKKLGISPRMIGLTILATGTSLPEISVALKASINKAPGIAIGDAIGSNITNIGLVFGLTTLLIPLELRSQTLQKEWPILFFAMFIVGLLMLDGTLNQFDGGILMLCCLAVICWLIRQGFIKKAFFKKDILAEEYQKEIQEIKLPKAVFQFISGLILLPISAHIIVKNAVLLANYFEVSNVIIGLTFSALGTSLPELATSIEGARKKEYDMVVGNLLGSNIFNLLAVLMIPALVHPITLQATLIRDYAVMFALVVLLFLFAFRFNGVKYVTRFQGGFLVLIYVAYLVSVYFLH